MSNVKNYTKQGGDVTVIGGKLIHGSRELRPADPLEDSGATTIAGLKDDVNLLLAGLYEAGLMLADKTGLVDAILLARDLLEGAVVGEDPGEFPQAAVDDLETAIEAAETVEENHSATQTQVLAATTALTTAIAAFEGAEIPAGD